MLIMLNRMKTAQQTKTLLENNQAKEWGYKDANSAKIDGYDVSRVSVSLSEVANLLDISPSEVRRLFVEWRNNEGGSVCMVADLDTYYFPI